MCKVATNNSQTRGCENPNLVAAAAWSLLVAVAFGAALQRGSGGDGAVPLSCQASAAETQRCGKCRSAVLGGGGLSAKASSVYGRDTGRCVRAQCGRPVPGR